MGQPARKPESPLILVDTISQYIDSDIRRLLQTTFKAHSSLSSVTHIPTPLKGDVSAVVALHSEQYQGHLMVVFPQNTIFSLLERTYDVRFKELNKSVRDAVGEIANVLFGMVKKNVKSHGYRFQMALPSVIVMGVQHQVWASKSEGQLMNFDSECGPFVVAIDLCPDNEPNQP